ncbi:ATP-dependent metallopeptidase FtsH/Yme1/Tma family protein, partial [Acaryochloris sp. IP29b_bin.148]|uniref:ATP-dependent metallopeptidase FtsH/Yme1/Tma family protein n=1 Tax=Acaryochloris sp. IP29b_bin.148 TaxID=2969218 RepID=UPI002616890C
MPIKDKPQRPRPNLITSLLLFLPAILLIANLVLPFVLGPKVPRVPYSFFIEQVQDEQVARVSVGQDLIRYQLETAEGEKPQILETTPIFDLELPKLLEAKGVEFAATPPPSNRWFT